jgi:hypothetical protein
VSHRDEEQLWRPLAEVQGGVVARRQLVVLPGGEAIARRLVRAHRWQVVVPGVYATFTGPLPPLARLWALLLHAGEGSAAGGETALWLWRVRATPPAVLEVCVPHGRQVRAPPGTAVTSHRALSERVHPARRPPRLRVEEAVLDVADAATDVAAVVDVVLAAVQRWTTTPGRIATALDGRSRHRWRALLAELLSESVEGAQSPLELRYVRDVERPHGLPRSDRNRPLRTDSRGPAHYPDFRYPRWALRVEVDGREAHPAEHAFRDRARDNRALRAGEGTLRYGWREIAGDPCGVAAEVARVLGGRGWPGPARPCGSGCAVLSEGSAGFTTT